MLDAWGGENLSRLAREAKVGVATVARIKNTETSVGLDVLEKVAAVFGVQAWQLIAQASGEPLRPTCLSPLALDLARSLDQISDPALHKRAYAVASQVLSFGAAPELPAHEPEATASPALDPRKRPARTPSKQ